MIGLLEPIGMLVLLREGSMVVEKLADRYVLMEMEELLVDLLRFVFF